MTTMVDDIGPQDVSPLLQPQVLTNRAAEGEGEGEGEGDDEDEDEDEDVDDNDDDDDDDNNDDAEGEGEGDDEGEGEDDDENPSANGTNVIMAALNKIKEKVELCGDRWPSPTAMKCNARRKFFLGRKLWTPFGTGLLVVFTCLNTLFYDNGQILQKIRDLHSVDGDLQRQILDVYSLIGVPVGNGSTSVYQSPALQVPAQQAMSRIRVKDNPKTETQDPTKTIVPFVYMVHKRVNYMKIAMETLRRSDFPKLQVPLIISHDGRIPEMMEYVESLKTEFKVIQLFHPYSCYDHPNSFPGAHERFNENYAGDTYNNIRDRFTCCKHHFTWILKAVFEMTWTDTDQINVDNFFFMEEDYAVAPNIYSTIVKGLETMKELANETAGGFLGIGLHPGSSLGGEAATASFFAAPFVSGPMTLNRHAFQLLRTHAADYCLIDEYNWDWSLVHIAATGKLPHTMLMTGSNQVAHIGVSGGMHHHKAAKEPSLDELPSFTPFEGVSFHGSARVNPATSQKWGGWGHPIDHMHCMELLEEGRS